MKSIRPSQSAFALDFCRLILHAVSLGFEVTIGEVWRPEAMAMLNTGHYNLVHKETGDIMAFARRGIYESEHRRKLAGDLNLFKDGKYLDDTESHRVLGGFWEALNPLNRWGGRYGDGNHYERLTEPWR